MGSTLVGVNRVGVGVNAFRIRIRPLHRQFKRNSPRLVFRLKPDDFRVDDLNFLCRIEVFDIVHEAALVAERIVAVRCSFVGEIDSKALVEKSHLLESSSERFVIEVGRLKNFGVRPERDRRSRRIGGFTLFEGLDRNPVVEGLRVNISLSADGNVESARQGVNDRRTDTVQSTRHGVSAAAELATGVKDRKHHLDGGFSLGGVHIDRDSAAVIDTANGTIRKNRDLNERAVASKRFVHGIVDDFVNKMV